MEGQPFLPLLRQIRNQFLTEYQVCALLEQGQTSAEIFQEFPYMKGQILEKHIQNARDYGMGAFRKGLLAIDAAEIQAKNSGVDEQLLAELLIVKLTGKH
jgi:DNA polymerase-3 subunit delta